MHFIFSGLFNPKPTQPPLLASFLAGVGSSAPDAGTPGIENVDKRIMQCFPDIEKTVHPTSLVPKAGVAMQKRLGLLAARLKDLEKCKPADLVERTVVFPFQPLNPVA